MHPDSVLTHDDPEVKEATDLKQGTTGEPTMRVMAAEELASIAKLIRFCDNKLGDLDLSIEVNDPDGIKLGEVRQHSDWGYVFIAEQGGEL